AHDLLAGPDLGDRPVPARIEVDAQGLLMRVGLMSADDELGHSSPCLLTRPAAAVCHPSQGCGPAPASYAEIVDVLRCGRHIRDRITTNSYSPVTLSYS